MYNDIFDSIAKLKSGSFFRLTYYTYLPVKASFKNCDVRIIKVCSTITRTGVRYSNITNDKKASTTNKKSNSDVHYVNSVFHNRVLHNDSTGANYLTIYPVKSVKKSDVYYVMQCGDSSMYISDEESIKYYVRNSYWTKPERSMKMIDFKHIIAINYDLFNDNYWGN